MVADYHVVLVAAGEGTRLGYPQRKAAVLLAGRPMAMHSLRAAMAHPACCSAVLVVHEGEMQVAHDWLQDFDSAAAPVEIVVGGKTRRESVLAGLAAISGSAGDLVVIHDGARPVLHREDLERVLDRATESRAALLACPVTDTLHRSDRKQCWQEGVPREGLWQAQTPQVFDLKSIQEALAGTDEDGTDEVEAVARSGLKVEFVEPGHPNPKITTGKDLDRANALLRGGH
ncbi:MAG: 2-C-methyl-D-erythritol 4-phosphate cytidylyltransferase [Planctomycetota bacterium]|nr:2-C-methyl-D-erythritol 4-phosphate cytidylyltransferase [Planctomycetota bacterium]